MNKLSKPMLAIFVLLGVSMILGGCNFGSVGQTATPPGQARDIIQKAEQVARGELQPFDSVVIKGVMDRQRGVLPAGYSSADYSRTFTISYQSADLWRAEFAGRYVDEGSVVRLMVADGIDQWNETQFKGSPGVQIESLAKLKRERSFYTPLFDVAYVSRYNLDRCEAKLIGSDTVAGRASYVLTLGPSDCISQDGPGNKGDQMTVWIDKQSYIQLKWEVRDPPDGSGRIGSSEVTSIQYNTAINAPTFVYRPSDSAQISDQRENESGITWLSIAGGDAPADSSSAVHPHLSAARSSPRPPLAG